MTATVADRPDRRQVMPAPAVDGGAGERRASASAHRFDPGDDVGMELAVRRREIGQGTEQGHRPHAAGSRRR